MDLTLKGFASSLKGLPMPELRKDPIVGRWVIIATDRAKRPVALCIVEALPAGATGKVKRRLLDTPEVPVLYHFDLR